MNVTLRLFERPSELDVEWRRGEFSVAVDAIVTSSEVTRGQYHNSIDQCDFALHVCGYKVRIENCVYWWGLGGAFEVWLRETT